MTRTIRDAKLETRAARARLEPGRKPHWKTLIPGELHLGYRRRKKDEPGLWLARRYIGSERYRIAPLGIADDFTDDVMSFAEAQRAAQEHKIDHEGRKGKGNLTVADVINDYIKWMKAHRATADGARDRAELHILPELGNFKVEDLTTAQLNRWRDRLIEKPAQWRPKRDGMRNPRPMPKTDQERRARRHTANKSITILKAALNQAFHNGMLDSDTVWRKFKSFDDVDAARERFLTVAEAQRLLNAADEPSGFRDLVHAALLTGCRFGELSRLRVKDWTNGKIAILKSKSGKPRYVRLTEEGIAFFEQLTIGRDPAATMLVNKRLGREWRKSEQARPMRAACRVAGNNPPLGIHQLRHTWASLAVMAGVPLIVVADNLGHANTRMVEKHYAHLAASYMDEAIESGAPRFGAVKATNVKRMR
jgi:integrase